MRTALIAALAAVTIATSAGAVINVTSVAGPDGAGQTVLFNFNTGAPAGLSGNYNITTGTQANLDAAPLGDTTPYLVVPGQGTSGAATLNLGGSFNNLSFYWGSIDSYNSVTFFSGANGTGTNLGTITGAQAGGPANGAQLDPNNNRRVFFTFDTPATTAASVTFASSNIAFELDDVSTAGVPEPSVWATLIAGFSLVGFSMRRRRQGSVAA